jgi:hypothetical protein
MTIFVALAAVSAAATFHRATAQPSTPPDPPDKSTKSAEPAPQPESNKKKIDPKADRLLHEMSDRLAALSRFETVTHNTLEVVTKEGEKLEFDSDSRTNLERPNKLRSQRLGEVAQLYFYYDGKTITLYGAGLNYYAQTPAPPELDKAMDLAREKLGLEAPMADLLYTDVYQGLMQDVTEGDYVSEGTIEGSPCHHLAFRGKNVDWQIWIDANTKLPRKYLLITKDAPGAPEYSVLVEKWILDPGPVDFTFHPPPGAQQIEFLNASKDKAGSS